MGRVLLVFVVVVLLLFAFYDLIATPKDQVRFTAKPVWFLIILLPIVGPLLWLFFGAKRGGGRPPKRGKNGNGPMRGPDDDPDYLRGL